MSSLDINRFDFRNNLTIYEGHICLHYICPSCECENVTESLDDPDDNLYLWGDEFKCPCGKFSFSMLLTIDAYIRT